MNPPANFRTSFCIPRDKNDVEKAYLASHSLGLQAKNTRSLMETQLNRWGDLGVDGWFSEDQPWYTFLDCLNAPLARIVGANESEVVVMNTLTVNLHLLLSSFYTPSKTRHKVLMDGPTFPSDTYALASHIQLRGYDPRESLVVLNPAPRHHVLLEEDILEFISQRGEEFALIFFSGVNFLTGQHFPMEKITRLAKSKGCKVGFDLAHAVGNVSLKLHEWNVDFAVWCNYKYLCGGPGGIGGAFVNEHSSHADLQRLAGWWGNDPANRFQMHLLPEFKPFPGAAGWQLSTPSILSATPLLASLEVLQNVDRLPNRFGLTQRLRLGLEQLPQKRFKIITPPAQEGCQISLALDGDLKDCLHFLAAQGIVCDGRPPHVLRITPVPAYSNNQDVDRFMTGFQKYLAQV